MSVKQRKFVMIVGKLIELPKKLHTDMPACLYVASSEAWSTYPHACQNTWAVDVRPSATDSLVFQVYTLDHPLVDLHAFSLGSWPAAFPRLDLGSDSDALIVKQLSALSIISLEGLTARCMAMHFMPTSWAPCFVNWCALTLIPSLHQACSLVQVWEVVFGFIPKEKVQEMCLHL